MIKYLGIPFLLTIGFLTCVGSMIESGQPRPSGHLDPDRVEAANLERRVAETVQLESGEVVTKQELVGVLCMDGPTLFARTECRKIFMQLPISEARQALIEKELKP